MPSVSTDRLGLGDGALQSQLKKARACSTCCPQERKAKPFPYLWLPDQDCLLAFTDVGTEGLGQTWATTISRDTDGAMLLFGESSPAKRLAVPIRLQGSLSTGFACPVLSRGHGALSLCMIAFNSYILSCGSGARGENLV